MIQIRMTRIFYDSPGITRTKVVELEVHELDLQLTPEDFHERFLKQTFMHLQGQPNNGPIKTPKATYMNPDFKKL